LVACKCYKNLKVAKVCIAISSSPYIIKLHFCLCDNIRLIESIEKHFGAIHLLISPKHLRAEKCEHSQKNIDKWASSQLGYPKGWSYGKRIATDYLGFLLHLHFMIIVDWYMTINRMMSC
jgi:hypothetical protein